MVLLIQVSKFRERWGVGVRSSHFVVTRPTWTAVRRKDPGTKFATTSHIPSPFSIKEELRFIQ